MTCPLSDAASAITSVKWSGRGSKWGMVTSAGEGCGRGMKLNKTQPHDETTVASVLSMFLIITTQETVLI